MDKQTFIEYYSKHTGRETARYFNLAYSTISKYARKYEVSRRSYRHKEISIPLSVEQMDIISGSLLGDGGLECSSGSTQARFYEKHGIQQKEYVEWKANKLLPYSTKIFVGIGTTNGKTHEYCRFRTINHPVFTELRNKWYRIQDGKIQKTVPDDLKLTPLTIAIWYFDDGYNAATKNTYVSKKGLNNSYNQKIWLYTNGFSWLDVEKLVEKLKLSSIQCKITRSGSKRGNKPQIYIGQSSYSEFIDRISPFVPCNCLQYKATNRGIND